MNILNIVNNKIIEPNISNIYINDYSKLGNILKEDNLLFIYIEKDSHLDLLFNYHDNKEENIIIYIDSNCSIKITELKQGQKSQGKIKYIIANDSHIIINKFCDIINITETTDIELNGINSGVDYYFSTISNADKKYKLNIYHNKNNTKSNVCSHGVSLALSNLEFDINGYIKRGSSNAYLNQESKIMMLEDNKSIIRPNLYIDEDKVEAKHSSIVGKFNDQELFYLKSRGLDHKTAVNLLIKAFLLGRLNINDETRYEILKIINSYGGEKYEYKK
jgi:hypothetical protein